MKKVTHVTIDWNTGFIDKCYDKTKPKEDQLITDDELREIGFEERRRRGHYPDIYTSNIGADATFRMEITLANVAISQPEGNQSKNHES